MNILGRPCVPMVVNLHSWYLFIYLFRMLHVPGIVLGSGHIAVNKTDKSPWSCLAHIYPYN